MQYGKIGQKMEYFNFRNNKFNAQQMKYYERKHAYLIFSLTIIFWNLLILWSLKIKIKKINL